MLQWVFKQVIMWMAVVVIASVGFDALSTLSRSTGAPTERADPRAAATPHDNGGERSTTIRSGADGHFVASADVDGADIEFLVDTGASGVVLTPEDAERVGIRVTESDFTLSFHTANGIVRAAPITLRRVRIGSLVVRNVDAAVNEVSMGVSLLGVSFLSRLDGYQVRGDRLILYW